jgi:NADPH:quinone reductase-like Zn-dependent oxidoreductase
MALVADLLTMVAAGDLRPLEPVTYPLDQVADALDDLLARRINGKVALIP